VKNAQLELYHAAAEEERHLVAHLMERMMQAEGLRDEGLRYWLQPSDVVSGDLVAAARGRSGKLFAMVADSTGHGLPAALNLLPLKRIFYRMVEKGFPVSTIVEEMNLTIKEQSPTDRFVATTLASVDVESQVIEIWIGGNPAAVFVDAAGKPVRTFASANLPLGILDKTFVARPVLFCWQEAGYLLMLSDGLLEAENEAGEALGLERVLQGIAGLPAERWVEAIQQAMRQHLGERRAHDDVSLILVNCPVPTGTGAG
jgi:serine phosphatase RsbU (regulator of sigma subunit)